MTVPRLKSPSRQAQSSLQRPLADRMRPAAWEFFEGLESIDRALVAQLRSGKSRPPSLILWGPPGSGKTTFAKLVGSSFDAEFIELSAVLSGVKEVREVVADAQSRERPTILFVDEIHRFNKAQQDAFLPHIENGTIIFIGATTENPSFYLNGALLSRCKVVVLRSLADEALQRVLQRATQDVGISPADGAAQLMVQFSGGDARRLLNLIEELGRSPLIPQGELLTPELLRTFLGDQKTLFYDRDGEEHYNMASAFIKSMRGSDPDASLYWGFRMLESGEDPRFIIRRLMIFASEDIGNADPRALQLAVSTYDAFERIGLPEGRIPIAHCITYLASAPKSNRSYIAMHRALKAIGDHPKVSVPLHLRNAPTGLMKNLSYGAGYEYPHDAEGGYARNVRYLPDEIGKVQFYEPVERGYEKTIAERLALLRGQKDRQ